MLTNTDIQTICGPKTNAKFNALELTPVGTVAGIRFYEHPIFGDESPLIVKTKRGWIVTTHWETPTIEDFQ
jgi:hypothetical protein